jgi:hypothetical protein
MKLSLRYTIACVFLLIPALIIAQGSVYLVLGSDTAIWDGMNVGTYACTYSPALYQQPSGNAFTVMDPAFRQQFRDSYGQPMKMTWWMMAGNIFRYATNTNVPVPNIMTLYLMKQYHGGNIAALGDELSLHYHTFAWTDYDRNGIFYWNQARSFAECKDDFDVTVAQFLLEENIFPASFRSGWHYMDTLWQRSLDDLVPYSLHNAYPSKRASTTEPIDNVFDWSRSSKEYVPFHPSLSDYQVPGNGRSWNTRSRFMGNMKQADMDSIFAKAMRGIDQVPCLWAHLPEADFPQNMKRIDSLAHASAAKYPSVKFRYCTAVEAMQRWRLGNDTIAPELALTEILSGDDIFFSIQTNEPIFQAAPFVAVKDIHGKFTRILCAPSGLNQWMTDHAVKRSDLMKAGVAVTDTMGNSATAFLSFLPDDIYIDNTDVLAQEIRGSWMSSSVRAWGTDSRQCVLGPADTAVFHWTPAVESTRLYSIFVQVPSVNNRANNHLFKIYSDGSLVDSVTVTGPLTGGEWNYITTSLLTANADNTVQMIAAGCIQPGTVVIADVMKLTAVIKEREIFSKVSAIDPGVISEDDTTVYNLKLENRGINTLTISDLYSMNGNVTVGSPLPMMILGMKSTTIPLKFFSTSIGTMVDTLVIKSNDLNNAEYTIPVHLSVEPYFKIIDNEEKEQYSEAGLWYTSVAQAWGPSSRYAPSGNGASATFTAYPKRNGHYTIYEIVPKTVNAVTGALYIIAQGTDTLGSMIIDQNFGSGNWRSLGRYFLTKSSPVSVTVFDKGPASNLVLRADAVKFQILTPASTGTPADGGITTFALQQNYPNPFNPQTTITFSVPNTAGKAGALSLRIFDLLGREIAAPVNDDLPAGNYSVLFDGSRLASGVYYYQLRSGSFVETRRMILTK